MVHLAPPPVPLTPDPVPPPCAELDLSISLSSAVDRDDTETARTQHHSRRVQFAVDPENPSALLAAHTAVQSSFSTVKPQTHGNQSAAEEHRIKGTAGEAQLNTTLSLKVALQQLEEAEFDSRKAVKDKLQKSVTVKESIRSRAAEGVNFRPSHQLYNNLVSVTLSHDELITQALRDRPALVPPAVNHSTKLNVPPPEGPDPLFFHEPHCIIRETPLLPGDHIVLPHPEPVPRPANMTFYLHQRQRQWEV